jgi:DNA polymerase III epsilon subunit-like protein
MTDTALEAAPEETVPETLGRFRLAELMARRFDLPVTADDVDELLARGHLGEAGRFRKWPVYSTASALALDAGLLERIVTERTAWLEASLPLDDAAKRISWHWHDLKRMGDEGRVTRRGDRYLLADVDRLATEADGEQHITGKAAAEVLEIRHPVDWKYVEDAGWIEPAETYEQYVRGSRTRTLTVALYRLADVRALRDLPGVDWEAVRGLHKGAPSPLREYAHRAPSRAAVVRSWAQDLADRHGVTVWAWCSPYTGDWEVDWERLDGAPTKEQVARELSADPAVGAYASEITLCPAWGRITRRARALLEPDTAVILDTETTDLYGRTVEVAVIDAATGRKLLDTVVNPEAPISRGAFWVHGISDDDVAGAHTFDRILPRLRKVTKDRVICAYNEEFDRSVVVGDAKRVGKKPMHLADRKNWWCLMDSYATWLGASRWLRLGGGHRALGDCQAAREVLLTMAKGRGTALTPRPAAPGDPVPGPPAGTALSAPIPEQASGNPTPV